MTRLSRVVVLDVQKAVFEVMCLSRKLVFVGRLTPPLQSLIISDVL